MMKKLAKHEYKDQSYKGHKDRPYNLPMSVTIYLRFVITPDNFGITQIKLQ